MNVIPDPSPVEIDGLLNTRAGTGSRPTGEPAGRWASANGWGLRGTHPHELETEAAGSSRESTVHACGPFHNRRAWSGTTIARAANGLSPSFDGALPSERNRPQHVLPPIPQTLTEHERDAEPAGEPVDHPHSGAGPRGGAGLDHYLLHTSFFSGNK